MQDLTEPRAAFNQLAREILREAGIDAGMPDVEPGTAARLTLNVGGTRCAIYHLPANPERIVTHCTLSQGLPSVRTMETLLKINRGMAHQLAGSFGWDDRASEIVFSTIAPLRESTAPEFVEALRGMASHLGELRASL